MSATNHCEKRRHKNYIIKENVTILWLWNTKNFVIVHHEL